MCGHGAQATQQALRTKAEAEAALSLAQAETAHVEQLAAEARAARAAVAADRRRLRDDQQLLQDERCVRGSSLCAVGCP